MRRFLGIAAGILAGLVGALPAHALDTQGLGTAPTTDASPWQGRVSFATATPVWRSGLGGFESGGFTVRQSRGLASLHLLGDYFFYRPGSAADIGGVRATSGLIVGPRSQLSVSQTSLPSGLIGSAGRVFGSAATAFGLEAAGETAALPYVGVGYTGASIASGWRVSADLGLVGPRTAAAAGRLFGSSQRNLDDTTRDLRPMPLLQVGVLYSF